MSRDKMKTLGGTQDYSTYIETLRSVVKQNEVDKNRVEQLRQFTSFEESKLQNHVHHLRHLQEIQQREYQMWQTRAQELANQQRELELSIQKQSQSLAFSKAELEHGLRMINLMPSSRPSDYLANTGLHKSPSENIRGDWEKVGDQLAQSYFYKSNKKK
jgi:myo-inositol-1-phosphate synthase